MDGIDCRIVNSLLEELGIDEQYLEDVAKGKVPSARISKGTAESLLFALHPIRLIKRFWPGSP